MNRYECTIAGVEVHDILEETVINVGSAEKYATPNVEVRDIPEKIVGINVRSAKECRVSSVNVCDILEEIAGTKVVEYTIASVDVRVAMKGIASPNVRGAFEGSWPPYFINKLACTFN